MTTKNKKTVGGIVKVKKAAAEPKLYAVIGAYDLTTFAQAKKAAADYWEDGTAIIVEAKHVVRRKPEKSTLNLPVIEV